MPTYEYKCDACGHEFEEWQSFSAEVLTKCPACKKKKLQRLFGSGAAILFKGSGFYETDYNRGESYQKSKTADETAPTPAATTTEAPCAGSPAQCANEVCPAKVDKPKKAGKK